MLEFFVGITTVIFIIYQFVGLWFVVDLHSDPSIVPNPNKRKLAILLTGPAGWIVAIIWFTVSSIIPVAKNIFKWFSEE